MPFTVSHAAAALPFRPIRRLPWSALVIGTFGPDFQYFLRMHFNSRSWHHYPDLYLFCFPFTLLAYFLFHAIIKRPIATLLPTPIQRRIAFDTSPWPKSLPGCAYLCVALILGLATHVLWDSITHPDNWFWAHIPILRSEHVVPYLGHVFGFELAQTASSIAGLAILCVSLAVWYRKTPDRHPEIARISPWTRISIWLLFCALAVVASRWRVNAILGPIRTRRTESEYQTMFVICAIAIFLWEILAYGLFITLLHKKEEAHS